MSLVRSRIVLPLRPSDIFQVIRPTQSKDAVLDLTYQQLISALSEIFSGGGSLILLKTNGTDNPNQNILNLVAGTGVTLDVNDQGDVTINSFGGAFITDIADTSDIDLSVTSGVLTGDLVDVATAGAYGSGTQVPQITIDSKGRVTSVSLINITAGAGTVTSVGVNPGTGISATISGTSTINPTINITNTAPDVVVGIAGGDTIGVSGAYPSFTLRTNVTTPQRLLGRYSAGAGAYEEILIGANLTLSGGTLSASGSGPGSVTSVSGTTNRISASPTTGAVVVDIDANYVGQTSITTLGTIGTGTWNGSAIGTAYGGTGLTSIGSAFQYLRVNSGGSALEYATLASSSLNDTTGILFGGALSATIGGTTFSVTAGIGQIITQTASITGVVTTASNVTWSAVAAAPITNIATHQFTYVLVNSSGTVIQQTSPFTDAQYKTHIIIGILCHINLASVNLVTNSQNVAYEDPHRLVELITSFGPIKKIGLNIGPNGANLRVNRTSGEAFKIGTNYTTDQFEPDVSNISAQTPVLLCRVHRDGSGGFIFDVNGGSYYNNIDPNNYDNGSGTLQSVGGSKWTIQRLFFFPNNPVDIICYYGVQVYNQFSEARANLEFETFDEAQITAENAVFLGFLFVRNAATNLSLTTQAVFLQSGLFRGIPPGGGGSGGGGNSIGELTGDVTTLAATAPSQSLAATIANNAVTYAKMQAVSTTSRLLGSNDTTTAVQEIIISTGLTLTGNTLTASGGGGITALTVDVIAAGSGSVTSALATPLKTGSFGVTVDGVTTLIQFGITGFVVMPYGGTVTGWSITANALGSIQFDVWKATNAIPTSSIIPSPADRPKLTNQQFFNYTSAISGWSTVAFAAGDVFGFYVDSSSGLKNATLTLRCTKSPS
jgi:hypothetical protein